jgi:hypothetical protein
MDSNQEMWTPLEAALAPFKELARLNRQSVTDKEGHGVQIVLKADRCHVRLLDRIRTDISSGLQSGALKPGVAWRLGSSR